MQIDELVKREKMIAVANEFEYLAFYGDSYLVMMFLVAPTTYNRTALLT